MQRFTAHEAKARFGALLDTARREPVAIEKHGRAVAVLMSTEDFDALETMKLERLRWEVQRGIDASAAGDVVEVDGDDLDRFIDTVMTGGEGTAAGR